MRSSWRARSGQGPAVASTGWAGAGGCAVGGSRAALRGAVFRAGGCSRRREPQGSRRTRELTGEQRIVVAGGVGRAAVQARFGAGAAGQAQIPPIAQLGAACAAGTDRAAAIGGAATMSPQIRTQPAGAIGVHQLPGGIPAGTANRQRISREACPGPAGDGVPVRKIAATKASRAGAIVDARG